MSDAKALGVTTPFHFGAPTFGIAAIVSMLIVMFITAVETTGDVFATGEIVGKPIRRTDIARAVRADGLATTLGGVLNSFPYTAFAENVGLVRLTKVKSRFVVAAAGGVHDRARPAAQDRGDRRRRSPPPSSAARRSSCSARSP